MSDIEPDECPYCGYLCNNPTCEAAFNRGRASYKSELEGHLTPEDRAELDNVDIKEIISTGERLLAQSARIEELTKALERSKIRMETTLKTLPEKSGEHLDLSLGIAQIVAVLSPTPTNGKDAE